MMYDRRIRDIVRYAHGEKIEDFHIPTTLADYRAVYKAYLHDPDLQDARARWPFVQCGITTSSAGRAFRGCSGSREKHARRRQKGCREPGVLRVSAGEDVKSAWTVAASVSIRPKRRHAITKFDEHGLGEKAEQSDCD